MENNWAATIKPSDIEFGERFRTDYGDIDELAESIKSRGLLHPLVVMRKEDDEGKYLLLAGGRRFQALEKLGTDLIPVRIFNYMPDELEIRSIELEENVKRHDMSWNDVLKMQRELHRLKQKIHGTSMGGGRSDLGKEVEKGWTIQDTAETVGKSYGSVSEDLKLAELIEEHPEIFAKAKNKTDAKKIVKKMETTLIHKELATNAEKRRAMPNSKNTLIDSYMIGSFFDGVKKVPDGSVNLVEIDPPYGIDLKSAKMRTGPVGASSLDDYNEIQKEHYVDFMGRVFEECYRTMADHSWLVCWFAHEPWFETMHNLIQEAGFKVNRMVGVWVKMSGQSQQPNTNLANVTEMFFYARKGTPALAKPGSTNVFAQAGVPGQQKVHPTERPVELMKDVLGTFGLPGNRVMIPFAGSGSTLIAAEKLGMTPFGWDLQENYKNSFSVRVMKGE